MGLRVGIDLDGVVYPFVDMLRQWLVEERGRLTAEQCPPADHWDFYKDWGLTTPEFLEEFCASIHAGFMFHQGEPIPGSIETMHKLADEGHELIVITSRHIIGAEAEARRATLKWLASHDVALSGIAITPDKGVLATDLFLEDAEHNYDSLEADEETMPILLTQAWNAEHPGRRVADWTEFDHIVTSIDAYFSAWGDGAEVFESPFDRQMAVRDGYEAAYESD